MTDKEKILANIEFLLNETNYEPFTDEVFGRIQSLKELKSYIDSLQEEPVSEDLEAAADSYIKTHGEILGFGRQTFKAGAKWKKEQLIKEAIDGIARPDDNEIWCNLKSFNFKDGDKVKVIIIKD